MDWENLTAQDIQMMEMLGMDPNDVMDREVVDEMRLPSQED